MSPDIVRKCIKYEHVVIMAGMGSGEEALENPDPMGYRLHPWEETDAGVQGFSSAIGTRKKETHAEGLVWAAHCGERIGNWGVYLPQLYRLYQVVENPVTNPFSDLSVEGTGVNAKYRCIPNKQQVSGCLPSTGGRQGSVAY